MTKIFFFNMQMICAFALFGFLSSVAIADTVYTGFEASSFSQATTTFSAGVTTGPVNNEFSFGGEGYASPISYATSFGSQGSISAAGFLEPELKGLVAGFGDEGVYNYVGMMATYQYDGATAGTVSYNWALDAVLTETDPDNAATLRYRGGIVTGADFFSTNVSSFFESSGSVEDSFSFFSNVAGAIDETGTISFDASPGDVFYLVTSLQTYAGRGGAIADAFNTATGSFTVSGGGSVSSLSAVPEPAAGAMLALLGLAGFVARRRSR